MNREKIFQTLLTIKKVFGELNIPFFLIHGLALGLYRDHKFVDKDLDIGIDGDKYSQRWKEIESKFKDHNIILRTTWWTEGNKKVPRLTKGGIGEGITIDIAYHYKEGNYVWKIIEHKLGGKEAFDAYLFTSFYPITFRDEAFIMPNPPDKYLEEIYGKDWINRDRKWHFSKSRTLKKAKRVFKK